MEPLSQSAFARLFNTIQEGDVIEVHYIDDNISSQRRNPLSQTMVVKTKRGQQLIGEKANNPSRNRGLAIVNRVYGGTRVPRLVGKNYVGGMRDEHNRGKIVDIKIANNSNSDSAFDFS